MLVLYCHTMYILHILSLNNWNPDTKKSENFKLFVTWWNKKYEKEPRTIYYLVSSLSSGYVTCSIGLCCSKPLSIIDFTHYIWAFLPSNKKILLPRTFLRVLSYKVRVVDGYGFLLASGYFLEAIHMALGWRKEAGSHKLALFHQLMYDSVSHKSAKFLKVTIVPLYLSP